jgi:hypothetical protein
VCVCVCVLSLLLDLTYPPFVSISVLEFGPCVGAIRRRMNIKSDIERPISQREYCFIKYHHYSRRSISSVLYIASFLVSAQIEIDLITVLTYIEHSPSHIPYHYLSNLECLPVQEDWSVIFDHE